MTWAVLALGLCRPVAWAGPHDAFMSGPWEVTVRIGLDGDILHFPIAVEDEQRPQALSQTMPVRGTSARVAFTHYVPDLTWVEACVPDPAGGCVAKLRLVGEGLDQKLWLSSGDVARQSISAPVGGVTIREVRDPQTVTALMQSDTVGVLWVGDGNRPAEIPARVGEPLALDDQGTVLTVLRYLPHYVMDRETKAVVSQSNEPVNPALRVRLVLGGHTYERWVWERFKAPPHDSESFPMAIQFANTYMGSATNRYLLVAVRDRDATVLTRQGDRLAGTKAKLGQPYAFGDSGYHFSLEEILHGVVVQNTWKNNSERRVRPALVGVLQIGDARKEVVLEFNKPCHCKTEEGTLVLIYQRRMPVREMERLRGVDS